MTKVLEQCK